ncbi:Myb/SANT-like domain-containing protein [Tanacetum coccineum]
MIVASLLPKNKNVESLKTTSLPFPELCAPLCDGTLSSDVNSHGPSSTEPRRVVEPHTVEDDEHIEVLNVESPTHPCSSHAPRLPIKTKKRGKQLMDGVEEEILGVLKVIANKINQPRPPLTSPPSVEDCKNKEGWIKLKPQRYVNWVDMIGRGKGFSVVPLQQQQLLYNGNEMRSNETLSGLGVADGDLMVTVSNASSAPPALSQVALDPDRSTVNPAAFQQHI